jgi:hypothetical protein
MKLRQVLIRLQYTGLKVNAKKYLFCATETEYLGYVLTRDGIKPQPKKVNAILVLTPPQNVKQSVDSWAWSSTTDISGRDVVKCCPHSAAWLASAGTPRLHRLTKPNRIRGIGTVFIRQHLTM